ncbi:MAG: hypothetical protein P1U74_09905 [Legionellaceae bacterium]|nr:hypothetical protein [Legionellaceae bacterium]
MNVKRFISAVISLFAFIFLYEWFVHGVLLSNIYQLTPSVWRSYDELQAYLPYNTMLMGIISLWVVFIFTRFYPEGGCKNGVHFGVYLGIFSAIQAIGAYFYLPIPMELPCYWFIAYLIENLLGGILIGFIYRR